MSYEKAVALMRSHLAQRGAPAERVSADPMTTETAEMFLRRAEIAEAEAERLRTALRKIAELNLPYRDTANRARSIALASLDAPSIHPEASS